MSLEEFVVAALATFWAWETMRYAAERYLPQAFDVTRAVHPLVVAAGACAVTQYYRGPWLVEGVAVAGVVGILHLAVERFLAGSGTAQSIPGRARRRGGLPSLP